MTVLLRFAMKPNELFLQLLALTTCLLGPGNVCKGQERLPNIVVIVADDLGYGDLACYGSNDIKTPNLDRLAGKGVRFTQFYANGPECTPTRVALLTGRYQQRVGGLECAIGLGNVGRYDEALALSNKDRLGLPVSFSALPKMLKEKGYNTALIGKWHLGDRPEFSPLEHGFDFALGPIGGSVDYFHHTEPKGVFLGIEMEGAHDLYRQGSPHHRKGYYLTDLITDEAVAWLNIQKDSTPFFLYLPYTSPHTPYQGPHDYEMTKKHSDSWNEGSHETYLEMVENLDEGIGKVVAKLEKENLLQNTLIVFFSDNGPTSKGSAGDFRGYKGQVFEGGIRVPCIIRWPGKIPEGVVSSQVAMSMDITASIASIVDYQPQKPFDGYDIIRQAVESNPNVPRTVYWRKKRGTTVNKAVRSEDFKYIQNIQDTVWEEYLFDLKNDAGEENNLIQTHPQVKQELKALLVDWENEVKPERE